MSLADRVGSLIQRRPLTDVERAARAEAEIVRRGFDRGYSSRNRKSQLLLIVAFCATFAGGSLALVGSYVGFGLLAVGLPATVVLAVWCLRNWDY
jgi:hypothetical protein